MATRAKADNGEGAIVRDGDGWKCQWTLKDGSGKSIFNENGNVRRPLVRGKTKEEVRARRDKLKREAAAGTIRGMRAKTTTAAQVVDAWMKTTGRNKETSTAAAYRGAYRNHISKHFAFAAENCTGEVVNDIIFDKVIPSIKRNVDGSNSGRSTAKRVFDMLSAAMKWAASSERKPEPMLTFNPMRDAKRGDYGKQKQVEHIPTEDVRAILTAARAKPSQLIWRVLFRTGMRSGEILGLEVRHIDFRRRKIMIEQISTPDSGGRHVKAGTKTGETREVGFPMDLYDDLAALTAGRRPDAPLFVGPQSPRLMFCTLRTWFQRDMKAAGVGGYTIHQFRHSFATHALLHGTPVIVVSKALGHRNVNVTWNTYGHVMAGSVGDAIDSVAASIDLSVATEIATESTEQPSIPTTARAA